MSGRYVDFLHRLIAGNESRIVEISRFKIIHSGEDTKPFPCRPSEARKRDAARAGAISFRFQASAARPQLTRQRGGLRYAPARRTSLRASAPDFATRQRGGLRYAPARRTSLRASAADFATRQRGGLRYAPTRRTSLRASAPDFATRQRGCRPRIGTTTHIACRPGEVTGDSRAARRLGARRQGPVLVSQAGSVRNRTLVDTVKGSSNSGAS